MALLLLLGAAWTGCRSPGVDHLDIRPDGIFEDWAAIEPSYSAPGSAPGRVREVRLADSPDRLFIRLDLDEELILQGDNELVLHLDLDRDPDTGLPLGGIGADFTWIFSKREGELRLPGRDIPLNAYQAGIVSAPAVSSARFEVEISKNLAPEGYSPPFSSPEIGWLVSAAGPGGESPDGVYRLQNLTPARYPEIPIGRPQEPHFRLVSYNVLWGGIALRPEPF